MKIKIIGAGYVGLAHACLFSENKQHEVELIEINQDKLNMLKKWKSPIKDKEIEEILKSQPVNLSFNNHISKEADVIFIAVPTSWNENEKNLDTSILSSVLSDLTDYSCPIVIKSTIPVGFTQKYINKYNKNNILFSPEFLREGSALKDLKNPYRTIIGTNNKLNYEIVSDLYKSVIKNKEAIYLMMSPTESEMVKLASNTYLAMRVAFFNEIDTLSQLWNISPKEVISGLSFDPRIGNLYNNPSFGYGGYCLPKDTLQMSKLTNDEYFSLIPSISESNQKRKNFIVSKVLKMKNVDTVGIESFAMKFNSDNSRESALLDIADELSKTKDIIVFNDPLSKYKSVSNWKDFVKKSDIILANRINDRLETVIDKVFTTDLTNKD